MTRVVEIQGSPKWEPNAPEAILIADDFGRAVLAVNPHFDDADLRSTVLLWKGVSSASMGSPNDEGRHNHRLYKSGLNKLLWMGEVQGGFAFPRKTGRPPRHFILPLKEAVVEVIAGACAAVRISGSTRDASAAALDLDWSAEEIRFNI